MEESIGGIMEQLKITDKRIIKSTFINREIEYVWHLWTTEEGMKRFLGVESMIELKPHGAYELYFLEDGAKGLRGSEGCQVLSYVPYEMLSFTWNAPPNMAYVRNHEYKTQVVLKFNKIDDKQTLVELTHQGWPKGKPWDEAFDYFDQAWEYVFDRMTKV
jgi:uncharacterized protein YndB with AHSA1/START domain